MIKKLLITTLLSTMVLCANNIAFAEETDLQSQTYKIKDLNGKKYIQGITCQTTIGEVRDNLKCNKTMVFYTETSDIVTDDNIAKTGMYLQVEDEKYYIAVGLDINKDGNATTTDLYKICSHIVDLNKLDDISFIAADTNVDEKITATDILRTKRALVDLIDKKELYMIKGENNDFEYTTNIVTNINEITKVKVSEREKLTIPEQIDGRNVVAVCSQAFGESNKINEIEILKNISKIQPCAFANCSKVGKIIVSEENQNFSSDEGILLNKEKTEIVCYPPNKDGNSYTIPENVDTIKSNAFDNLKNLNELHIGSNVKIVEENGVSNWTGTIYGPENSAGIEFAIANNIKYEIIVEHEDGMEVENTGVYLIPPVDPAVTEVRGAYSPPPGNYGIDIARKDGNDGEKVVASMSGTIIEHRWPGYMTIENDKQTVKITYVHMDNLQFSLGAKVKQGDYIGTIGHQGLAVNAYPRVDFELWVKENGEYVSKDPTRYTGH